MSSEERAPAEDRTSEIVYEHLAHHAGSAEVHEVRALEGSVHLGTSGNTN